MWNSRGLGKRLDLTRYDKPDSLRSKFTVPGLVHRTVNGLLNQIGVAAVACGPFDAAINTRDIMWSA